MVVCGWSKEAMQMSGKDHELFGLCEQWFSFKVFQAPSIVRGWLNQKWKLESDNRDFLLKSFDAHKYSLYNEKALVRALQWQLEMQKRGLPCVQQTLIIVPARSFFWKTPCWRRKLQFHLEVYLCMCVITTDFISMNFNNLVDTQTSPKTYSRKIFKSRAQGQLIKRRFSCEIQE